MLEPKLSACAPMLGTIVRSETFARLVTASAGRASTEKELGLGLGMSARDLAEPFARLARLQRHLLPADVDQLFEIDRAELGRVRQALFRRGARVQHLKLGAEARGKPKPVAAHASGCRCG